jgi:ABC-type branched-subunit amino acid transport system substrate-binding protein
MRLVPRSATLAIFLITLAPLPAVTHGAGRYDPGASDTEIKIGNTNPYSGPASAYGTIGKVIGAYFRKVNEEGGIKGRKIAFISLDDGYSPPKTVEQVRRLVELSMALPGIKINTSPTDFYPIEQEQLARFNGEYWALFGEVYDAAKIR